ncbi:DinB family protein [Streptomyces sp. NPDC057654]|uniref:DinB family protein n=1 Tax=Streptomyces sp. NPDC057654 TaxID=3346196 RepID=UPI00369A4C54
MEKWGASLYGNPCGGCGFEWSLTPEEAIRIVEGLPAHGRGLLAGRTGYERHPDLGWTPAAYLSHITDNLRNWAERLAGARLSGAVDVPGYDPDLMAEGRNYNEIAMAAALWSLERAADAWAESVTAALAAGVVLRHATRGAQRAEDVARNNAHDGHHHLWDIERILRCAGQPGS